MRILSNQLWLFEIEVNWKVISKSKGGGGGLCGLVQCAKLVIMVLITLQGRTLADITH